jgi:long-chain acyl-CoA synthetase
MQSTKKDRGTTTKPANAHSATPAVSPAAPPGAAFDLPLERAYWWEKARANQGFLTQPFRGEVREWTWAQGMAEARSMAAFLLAQDWPPGSHIVILSKNCAWWIMAELAIWMAGHVTVPIYPSLSPAAARKLIEHSDPVACFTGAVDAARMSEDGIPPGLTQIAFPNGSGKAAKSWESIVASTPPLLENPHRAPDELATIIYTSGTTGAPKGAMHRFAAFAHFAEAVTRVVGDAGEERVLSYLPLAHIAERALVEAAGLFVGAHFFFVEDIKTFQADLRRARPTIFFSVPRLLVKFQQGVLSKIPARRLKFLLRIPIAGHLVRRKILREMGLDSVRLAASGGAPLPVETIEWYRGLGLQLVEGYGMTETGITHTPVGGESRPGYVGNGVPGVETRIAENGEVLVRSSMNMTGYYKDPEGSRSAFTADGFFRTGDLGELDADGWLRIIGRVKEQFKTSKGKYVSPAPIEQWFSMHPAVDACCVVGSGAPSPFAIVLGSQAVFTTGTREGWELEFSRLLDEVNARLEAHEKLRFIVVTDDPWTVENGLITPTLKLKRALLESRYAENFADWFSQGKPIVWHTGSASGSSQQPPA